MCLALGATQFTQAQLKFGVKAGINYNSDSFEFQKAKQDALAGGEGKMGYHAGIWSSFNIPLAGLYIRPELVFTALNNEIKNEQTSEKGSYDFQKIDIPVLIGKKFLKIGHAFIGPSFQYIIDGKISDIFNKDYAKIKDNSEFTVGLQLGAGIEISKFGIDVRWERGFDKKESELISNNTNTKEPIKFDTRVNQIILSISYNFL